MPNLLLLRRRSDRRFHQRLRCRSGQEQYLSLENLRQNHRILRRENS
jgi:hypothetical protein